ncbi:phosphate signaling complex protein PhoU [Kutzneria viridogrisea]|uniref:Phosphate-specific transport system accessory protein PhoU n=2 Tax=Kutzneria TaxID=43356 RepID=W5WAG7_9PSEU|nr:phosphate signaling complex protein PhoU [Kutzneria albida]AHH97551.1 hypothetical protein KALB_4188 [Kutzneria albida DSM 43870]MBA8930509.1 phosphate transport system protein [Kutzneria viridogrisea]
MREIFHAELDQFGQQLALMCHTVSEAMEQATRALLAADLALAERVIGGDLAIDKARTAAEDHAQSLLALQSPVATDLRVVFAGLRVAESLERMGDLARHVAQVARLRHPEPVLPDDFRSAFATMGRVAVQMAAGAEQAIRDSDPSLSQSLAEADDQIDALHSSLFTAINSKAWNHGVQVAVDVALLGRFYERYADHAVSVARRMDFVPTGTLWSVREQAASKSGLTEPERGDG